MTAAERDLAAAVVVAEVAPVPVAAQVGAAVVEVGVAVAAQELARVDWPRRAESLTIPLLRIR